MSADLEFELWLLWFRVLAFLRMSWRTVVRQLKQSPRYLTPALECLKVMSVAPIWFSFEACVLAWAWLEQHARATYGYRLREWHRLWFCLAASQLAGHALQLHTLGLGISPWSLLVYAGVGCILFRWWKGGARWSRQVLGIRPDSSKDPSKPYAGLDF